MLVIDCMAFQIIVVIIYWGGMAMKTTVQQTVDSEKKVWTRPVLARLDVKETANKKVPCNADNLYGAGEPCDS